MAQAARISQSVLPSRRSWRASSLWYAMLLLSFVIALYGATYFVATPNDKHFARYILPLRLHIAGGMGALLVGPWQFSDKLRARALNLHRWLGRFYLLEVGLGSIAGLVMAVVSKEGLATHLGFGILAGLWFVTGLEAYRSVRKGDVRAHREWMIRNFALTFAAVTLRIEGPAMLVLLHWSFRSAFICVSWSCWIPNLLIAEWIVRGRRRLRLHVGR